MFPACCASPQPADGYFAYFPHPGSSQPLEVLFADSALHVVTMSNSTRLKIVTHSRSVVLQFEDFREVMAWLDAFRQHFGDLVKVCVYIGVNCNPVSAHCCHIKTVALHFIT